MSSSAAEKIIGFVWRNIPTILLLIVMFVFLAIQTPLTAGMMVISSVFYLTILFGEGYPYNMAEMVMKVSILTGTLVTGIAFIVIELTSVFVLAVTITLLLSILMVGLALVIRELLNSALF